jgi:hypothetical protein
MSRGAGGSEKREQGGQSSAAEARSRGYGAGLIKARAFAIFSITRLGSS